MHANLRIGETTVMVSDGRCLGQPSFQGFALSLTVADEAEAERLFAALADGGQVQMPMTKTFFSPRFGMVADRFGVLLDDLRGDVTGYCFSVQNPRAGRPSALNRLAHASGQVHA